MAIRSLDVGITVYPGYYVKSIKLNGKIWEDLQNPFADVETITHHQISNTENYQQFFTFRATENSVFEIEFGVADIITIEYGDNLACYEGNGHEEDWHVGGQYYVSETYVTQLCHDGAIRDNNATKQLVALNTKPDGSGYNITPHSLTRHFIWNPIDEFSNGVSDKITLYAILECNSHIDYGAKETGWEYFDAKAPTCDAPGNVAYRHCKDCDIYHAVADESDYDVWDNELDPDGNFTYYKRSSKPGVVLEQLEHDYSKYTNNNNDTHTVTCTLCGGTKIEPHKYVDGVCICGEGGYLKGDVNDDGVVTDADAVHLLFYTIFPEDYPINQPADFNDDGTVTDADAVHLLFYTIFPEDYPLK